jgi:prefoldin subunit 5
MNTFKFFVFALMGAIGISACGVKSEAIEKEEALLKEVFAIHDAVMPKMSEIVSLKGQLKELEAADTTKAMEAKAAISQLEKGEEGMMEWMNKFMQPGKLRETKKHEEIMSYLESEKQRITKVRDDMNNSIDTAQRVLGSVQKSE